MNPRLIIALDYESKQEAMALVDSLDPSVCALKVGNELFTRWGTELVSWLIRRDFNVFLDLKFHDIPNTVANACKAAADLGVWMLNVHASGGFEMMTAAVLALEEYKQEKPLLIGVSVLTSFDSTQLERIGVLKPLATQVMDLAQLAKSAGLDGIVCSAREVRAIKNLCGVNFIAVTPGIRSEKNTIDDQVRVMTPKNALQEGSDYLVVGRPITRASDPVMALHLILQEMIF